MKRFRPNNEVTDWMIFYNNKTGRLGYLPVGASQGYAIDGNVIKGLKCTEDEAIKELRRLESDEFQLGKRRYYNEPAPRKQRPGYAAAHRKNGRIT